MFTRHVQHDLTWIDLISPTPGEVRELMQEFAVDPKIAQELLAPSVKSKVERHGHLAYLVLHFPALRGSGRAEQEIDFIIGKHFLITTRYENVDRLHFFAKAFEVESVLGHTSMTNGGHLFAAMARNLYHALLSECDSVERRLLEAEEKIFSGNERKMVIEISLIGRVIHDFRQALVPHREMLESLEPVGERLFGAEFGYHIKGVLGEYARVHRTLENLYTSLLELRETNNSLLSTKQNDIMKNLTIMAFMTFPLSLISSLFAIDARHRPIIGLPYDFWILLGLMAVLAGIFYMFFKYKKWI
ncbi:MAG: CorA family divalent cation transporter [Patescibacteria group bacterium]